MDFPPDTLAGSTFKDPRNVSKGLTGPFTWLGFKAPNQQQKTKF